MLTSILDLLGVALFGVVIALGLSVQTSTPPPSFLDSLLTEARVLGLSEIGFIAIMAAIAGLLLIAKTAITVVLTKKILRTLAFWQSEISTHLANELLSQPVVVLRERSSQETSFALTNGVNAATLGVIGQASIGLSEIALLSVLAIGLLFFYPFLTLGIIVFLTGLALVLQKSMSSWAGRVGSMSGNADIEGLRLIQESIRVYRELTVTGRRANYISRFADTRVLAASVQADAHFISSIPKYVFEIALVVGAALLFTSQFLTTNLESAVTATTVVLIASSRMIPSILRLQSAALGIRTSSAIASRTYILAQDLKRKSQELAPGNGNTRCVTGSSVSKPSLDIQVDNVSFTHHGNPLPTLNGVSVSVPVGTTLAVVGPTGSGKSTFADIVLGVCQPDLGTITIGGLPPHEAIEAWPGAFGYVPQEVVVVQGSVRANVAIGMNAEEISDSKVWKALEAAHLASFLIENRQGLDTLVGEDGFQLSGGQRQRLGIARALYSSPMVLVMDEATSALDAETEMAISQTLGALEGEVTTVIVAHRLASVRQAHQVLYLEDGVAKAIGTFEEVRYAIPRFNEQARLLGL